MDNILKYVDSEKIYALLGNHDHDYIGKFNLKNLNGKVIDVNGVKILGNGTLEKSLTVKGCKFSKSAAEKIEAAGGKVEVI